MLQCIACMKLLSNLQLRHPHARTPPPAPAGAGSSCEGEDWEAEGMLPSVDALTLHVYWRQTEGMPEQASGACCWPHKIYRCNPPRCI